MLFFSFNSGSSTAVFEGFSLKWYAELFSDAQTLNAVKNTLILAVSSSAIATVVGTAAAFGIHHMKSRYLRQLTMSVTNVPMMNPDIITGISLMLLFVFVGGMMGLATKLNFFTMLIAHITFSVPYVILSVLPKLRQMDVSLPEAALDLGCTPMQSFFKVQLPAILPGVFSGMIMAFTLSLDDFVISYFTMGVDFMTLPVHIYDMTKKNVKPDMYALATLIFVVVLILLLLSNRESSKDERMQIKRLKAERRRRLSLHKNKK
ncbi:MAG: ABC transporter permease [Ruminococcaceae bacterium]|nr:ABC transporter permease [Oscillospiraceae bacterium]